MKMMNNDIVLFETKDKEIKLSVSVDNDTVWLSANQMALLFDRDEKNIRKHINNVFNENELDRNNNTQKMRVVGVKQKVPFYTLDVIISVGYRVKSQRGTEFRQWANGVLKQYIIQGYAINEKRLQALEKTVEIQTKMLADALDVEEADILKAVNQYTEALTLLDQYDHQVVPRPEGNAPVYRITYEECKSMVNAMRGSFQTDVFGVEKEKGKLNCILESVYQNVFGKEIYPSIEDKAAHLLYFIVKDHPFVDGCKRIAATLFLEFLNKNGKLISDGKLVISNNTLVAITLLTAESKPEEMEVIISVIMHLLQGDSYE